MTNLLSATPQNFLEDFAKTIVYKEKEVLRYTNELAVCNSIINSLNGIVVPQELKDNLTSFPIGSELSEAEFSLLSSYKLLEDSKKNLKTLTFELYRANQILANLKAQIPADQLDALVAEALVKVNAQSAPSA
jgi:hypothetical protein